MMLCLAGVVIEYAQYSRTLVTYRYMIHVYSTTQVTCTCMYMYIR